MELRRCKNCGSFTTSEDSLCDVCANKLKYNNTVLKSYFEEAVSFGSIQSISSATGVSPSVIKNYMDENNYIETTSPNDDIYKDLPY